jgi:transposase
MRPGIALRPDYDAAQLRALAKASRNAGQSRRLLALAEIYDGGSRTKAAQVGGVGLQTIRDWVVRFNARGPEGLIDGKAPGNTCKLNHSQRQALAEMVENGPTPAIHGVVRWRLKDLTLWIWEEFRISISETTLSRELRSLGYRKLSARPRHYAQNPEALELFKKVSPPPWKRSGRASRRACVDAPSGARRIFGQLRRWIGCCHVSGLCCGGSQAAGPYGSSWIRSTSLERARSAVLAPGSPDRVSATFAPYLSFDLLTPSTASRPPTAYAATAGAR